MTHQPFPTDPALDFDLRASWVRVKVLVAVLLVVVLGILGWQLVDFVSLLRGMIQ